MTQENTNNNSRLAFFEKELNLIKNENVKNLTLKVLIEAPQWFFTKPASSSGNFHPEYTRGEGGLMMHTKAVVYLLKEMFRSQMYDIDEYHQDLLLLSAIAHDTKKFGNLEYGGRTIKEHPELAATYVEDINKAYNFLDVDSIDYIKRCITSHMGIWGNTKPETIDEQLLHLADLLASRKEVTIKIE